MSLIGRAAGSGRGWNGGIRRIRPACPKRYVAEAPLATVSIAIAHFAAGLLGTALLLALVAPRLLRSPTLLAIGGVWGMVPDAYWVTPVGFDALRALHTAPWVNLFWFHGVMDRMDPRDTHAFAAEVLVLLFVCLPVVELYARWRLGEFGSDADLLGVSESRRGSD